MVIGKHYIISYKRLQHLWILSCGCRILEESPRHQGTTDYWTECFVFVVAGYLTVDTRRTRDGLKKKMK